MSPIRPSVLLLVALVLAAPAAADAVCTAAQIIAVEPGCGPPTSTCTIAGTHVVDAGGCTFDFGARAVTLSGRLTLGSRVATLRAARFTVGPTGLIDGVGAPGARGGLVQIETSGAFEIKERGEIDSSGHTSGGEIIIRAGGDALLFGRLASNFRNQGAAGGLIDITAAGSITATQASSITARGGLDSDGGGEINLTAGGNIDQVSDLVVDGLDGGFIEMRAGGRVQMEGANASGGGDAGSGGCIDILGGAGVVIRGRVEANGASGTFMTGGCGGLICVDGDAGLLSLDAQADIIANGASPDGGGGQVSLLGLANIEVAGLIEARGPDGETCGGDVCIEAGLDAAVQRAGNPRNGARIDVSGGDAGGQLEITAGRQASVSAVLDASGRRPGALGGDVAVRAGMRGSAALTLAGLVDLTTAASCSPENGCGQGGRSDLLGCNVTIARGTLLDASGPDAGQHLVTAREVLRIQGQLTATRTAPSGANGVNRLVHRAGISPELAGSVIVPAPILRPLTTCPTEGPTMPPCLAACPICGNGQVEFPETCDPVAGPPMSCRLGCSLFCQVEDATCDDSLVCSTDTCVPSLGCRHQVVPACTEPPTPTATATGTPPTATPTPTVTATATETPSGTPTSSATASPTASVTPTAADTATATPSVEPTATTTSLPACPGDCGGDGAVAVNELIIGVNIALGNAPANTCPAFDGNGDGTVSIAELIAAVNAALNGC